MPTVSQVTADPALESQLFWDKYKTLIIAVVAALVLIGLGLAGYQYYITQHAADAAIALASAKSAPQYQEVIRRYPESGPAASAYLLLGSQLRTEKKYAEANTILHKFIDKFPKHELITTAWMGIAANLESLGKTDEALSTYERLVTEYPESFNAPLALLAEVPLLKAKNRLQDARKVCETVITKHGDSIVMNEAMRELMALPQPEAPPTAKIAPAAPAPAIPMARPPEPPAPTAKP